MKQQIESKNEHIPSWQILLESCDNSPEKNLFTFKQEQRLPTFLTGKDLIQNTQKLGSALQQDLTSQEKVVLLFPQGLEYIYSILACLYANVVAIPTSITDSSEKDQFVQKLNPVLEDSKATCILTNSHFKEFLQGNEDLQPVTLLDIHEIMEGDSLFNDARTQSADDIAILLYTSGSTSAPKGVMITHQNLVSQAKTGAGQWGIRNESCIVSWMPQFHNFGLNFNILAPLMVGAGSILLTPGRFVRDPEAWFKNIDQHQATHTAAPNFAFDYCCSMIDPVTTKELSLHSLEAIICGGEPIRKETYEEFTRKYEPLGLKKEVFCPHYGLSEMGSATSKKSGTPLKFLSLDIPSLESKKVKHTDSEKCVSVTHCGQIETGTEVKIVNPETNTLCAADEIGEIRIKSPSVAAGYLNQEEQTKETFFGSIGNTDETGFLRTGDLGFIEENNLYIVGREKEVIIIHGKNHHPVDIEWTIKKNVSQLTLPIAVFSCEVDQHEKVFVAQEVEPSIAEEEAQKITQEILTAVSETHELELYEINLVPKGGIPKTGSGKIQRKACRAAYLKGEFTVLYQYGHGVSLYQREEKNISLKDSTDLLKTLKEEVFQPVLEVDQAKIDSALTFSELGLNSIQYVRISKRIEEVFNILFAPVMLFKHRTFEKLAQYLSTQIELPKEKASETETQAPIVQVEEKPVVEEVIPADATKAEIAVVGISCHLPGGATDPETLWQNLIDQKDAISSVAELRPSLVDDLKNFYGNPRKSFPQWGGFITDTDTFDAKFFGVSPLEAESMDPQQRKLLELTWSVLENGGYNPVRQSGEKVGLFIGVHNNDYADLVARDPGLMETYGAHLDSGLHMSMVANRISRYLNFHGPSEVVNTACSSSLVTIHHAVQSILREESTLAVAGGINLILAPRVYLACHRAGMLAEDGRCKTFDEKANGFVRAEGYGAVLLKQYSQALTDGDTIHGIIKGVAINHDGQSNSLRAPNLNAQRELIQTAYQKAGLPPETIGYIEAHGTGTSLGDPIEVQALQEAFRELNPNLPDGYCGLGTIKTNIGHCESAAGIAGLIKLLMSMKHKKLPAILHYRELNPYISLKQSPFYIVNETKEWRRVKDESGVEIPRRAGVSSFGFGGSNAHVIVEEFTPESRTKQNITLVNHTEEVLVLLSAKNGDRLQAAGNALLDFLKQSDPEKIDLIELAYTLQVGREAMEERAVFLVKNLSELIQKLEAFSNSNETIENGWRGHVQQNRELVSLLDMDEDTLELMRNWISKGKLDKVAQLWAQGSTIDWNLLYGHVKPNRIPLPSYPFAKDRFWLQSSGKTFGIKATQTTKTASTTSELEPELMTFEEVWKEQPLAEKKNEPIKTVVCFLSFPENQQEAAEELQVLGAQTRVLFIAQGDFYQKQSDHVYTVSRTDKNSYEEAFGSIRDEFGTIDGILYMWPLEDSTAIRDYSPIVHQLQAINTTGLEVKKLLLAGEFENNLDRCYLESWIGFERSLGLVMPKTAVAPVLSIKEEETTSIVDWTQKLRLELQNERTEAILYQNEKRHSCEIRPIEAATTDVQPVRGTTWLITGGCGGLGLLFAGHLAKSYGANLILTGRSPLDEKKKAAIANLENLGGRVFYLQADVCDQEAMRKGLDQAKERFGSIHGLLHVAGIEEPTPIFEKETESFQRVLAPKIKGTLLLELLLAEEPLRFHCYFSSAAAILGDFGSCDYAIGNRFQMALASYCVDKDEKQSGKRIAINWPLWREGGMSFGEKTEMYLKSSGQRALEVEEGIQIFETILKQPNSHQLVLAGQQNRINRFLGLAYEPEKEQEQWQPEPEITSYETVTQQDSGKGRRKEMKGLTTEQCLLWDLKEHAGQLLRTPREQLNPSENLADFGFDSISLADFAVKLSEHYELEVTPALFFAHATLDKLVEYFYGEHQEQMESFYREEIKTVSNVTPPPRRKPSGRKNRVQAAPIVSVQDVKSETPEPIAIIGMSGRFPKARNLEEMWNILAKGEDVVEEIPTDRFDWKQYYGDPEKDPKNINSKWLGALPGIREFDPAFFEISAREAEIMDPRQRLLLQESWNALEDAGYGIDQLKNKKTGMFVGVEEGGYKQIAGEQNNITANHNGILAARLSYFLDLRGPNMAINTACSSALVATHQACQSLRNDECDTAIAAGINLLLTPEPYFEMSQAGMLSNDGKCFAFDKQANGMVPGEAVVAIVLKRLSNAEKEKDPIHAIIQASGVNYDGKTNGITAPNGASQSDLLNEVYEKHQINPETIEYIVTHGTGTKLGDPIEINALADSFRGKTKKQGYCALTSTKSNFGHTLAASGLVSLVSLVKAFQQETIPASLHCQQENDYILWKQSPFFVNKENRPWKNQNGNERTGAVSAFGMSGTNAHLVLSSYTNKQETQKQLPPYYMMALSAKTEEALREKTQQMVAFLKENNPKEEQLLQIAYTLLEGRQHFNHRCVIVIQDGEDAQHVWKQSTGNEKLPNLFHGKVVRDFTGQKVMTQYAEELLKESRLKWNDRARYQEILYALADLYCQGYQLQWNKLFPEGGTGRLHLPTYPFAKESYWIEEEKEQPVITEKSTATINTLHPLVHQNSSTLQEIRFTSTFTGDEDFMASSQTSEERSLPAAAWLEMARAAITMASAEVNQQPSTIRLKEIQWGEPMIPENTGTKLHISLFAENNGEIAYDIYEEIKDETEEPTVYNQGNLYFEPAGKAPIQNLETLKEGKFSLPTELPESSDQFCLHPFLIDSALRAANIINGEPAKLHSLRELEIYGNNIHPTWAVIQKQETDQTLNLDFCDNTGTVQVRMKGLKTGP